MTISRNTRPASRQWAPRLGALLAALAVAVGPVVAPGAARGGPAPSGGTVPDPGGLTPWIKQNPGTPGGTTDRGSNVPRDARTKRRPSPCGDSTRDGTPQSKADCPEGRTK